MKRVTPDINYEYVKTWLNNNMEIKAKEGKGFNSYVAPRALHEYHMDIVSLTDNQHGS